MNQDTMSPIDFNRDAAWIEQLKAGHVLSEDENMALWKDMIASFYLARSFRDTIEALQTNTALRYGAHESGLEDLQTRVEAHFADRDFDSLDLGVYLQDLRTSEAPHLFGQRAQTPPGSPAAVRAPAGTSRPPQPVPLSAAQLQELGALPPTERLAAYRKLEEQHQATVKGGKA